MQGPGLGSRGVGAGEQGRALQSRRGRQIWGLVRRVLPLTLPAAQGGGWLSRAQSYRQATGLLWRPHFHRGTGAPPRDTLPSAQVLWKHDPRAGGSGEGHTTTRHCVAPGHRPQLLWLPAGLRLCAHPQPGLPGTETPLRKVL